MTDAPDVGQQLVNEARAAGAARASSTCTSCSRQFTYNTDQPRPKVCGRAICRARHEWAPAEWDARCYFAMLNLEAGLPLNEFDIEALGRKGIEPFGWSERQLLELRAARLKLPPGITRKALAAQVDRAYRAYRKAVRRD